MAQQNLEEALLRDGEKKAREIWPKVEAKAERLRRATQRTLELQRQAAAAQRLVVLAARHEATLAVARKQAQRYRLTAESALGQRLLELAREMLEELALAGGAALFQALVTEVPDYPWQRIKVHRRDAESARNILPAAECQMTEEISAGLEVLSADGKIRITNTLEKRLEKLWPELLAELLQELRQRADDDETVA